MEKCGTARQVTCDNIIRRRNPQFACRLAKTRIQKRNNIMNNIGAKYFAARQQCTENSLFPFHSKLEHLYIVDSSIYANSNEKGTIVAFPWKQWLHQSTII